MKKPFTTQRTTAVSQVCNLQPDHTATAGAAANELSTIHAPLSTRGTAPRRVYLEQELLEVSAVAIPANPNALALAYKSGAVEKSDLNELSTLLKHTLSAQGTQPSTQGSRTPAPQPVREPSHIKFLRALHHVLRKT